jgi:hypothetical protein
VSRQKFEVKLAALRGSMINIMLPRRLLLSIIRKCRDELVNHLEQREHIHFHLFQRCVEVFWFSSKHACHAMPCHVMPCDGNFLVVVFEDVWSLPVDACPLSSCPNNPQPCRCLRQSTTVTTQTTRHQKQILLVVITVTVVLRTKHAANVAFIRTFCSDFSRLV